MALRYADYGYILESGRVVMDGAASDAARERGREGVLPRHVAAGPQELPRRQELQAPQALAGLERWRPRAGSSSPALPRWWRPAARARSALDAAADAADAIDRVHKVLDAADQDAAKRRQELEAASNK